MNRGRQRWYEFRWNIPFTRWIISVEHEEFTNLLWWWNAWAFRGEFTTNRVLRIYSVKFRLRSRNK